MANLVSFLASKLYDLGEWFHYHSPFFKRTNNVVENFNDGEGSGVDNRDVGSQQNVKIIFFSIDKKQFLDNCCIFVTEL